MVVRTETTRAPGNPVDRIVRIPFEHRVNVTVRIRVGSYERDTAASIDMKLEAIGRHFWHKRLVADIELRQGPVDRISTIGLPGKPLVGDESHSFLIGKAGVLAFFRYDEK